MIRFIVLGEGPSDIGKRHYVDKTWTPGPMWFLIETIINQDSQLQDLLKQLNLAIGNHIFFERGEFKQYKQLSRMPNMTREIPKEHQDIFLTAYALALYAKDIKTPDDDTAAIFFHDSDGTRSTPHDNWERIVNAMDDGFNTCSFSNGVPMVPRPKSEAWLLGYYQKNLPKQNAYTNYSRFEEMSGNDGSPNSLKSLLAKALNMPNPYDAITKEEIEEINWDKIDAESFRVFCKHLNHVLFSFIHKKTSHDYGFGE